MPEVTGAGDGAPTYHCQNQLQAEIYATNLFATLIQWDSSRM